MAAKKHGLGRGLDALLSSAMTPNSSDEHSDLRDVPVEQMQPGRYQPRVDMHPDSLQELADSIKAQGVVQPIVIRPISENKYEIIAGERRWRASQLAGLHEVPAVIRDVPDQAAMAMALIENIQREDLNPIEEANALSRLAEEFELTHQQVADAVGRSRAAVSNLLRLLELNPSVKKQLADGRLEMGHARALLAIKGTMQSDIANQVAEKALSVRATEQLVRRYLEQPNAKKQKKEIDPNVRKLQDELSGVLGAQVEIQQGRQGKGKLVVHYNTLEELDGILDHMK